MKKYRKPIILLNLVLLLGFLNYSLIQKEGMLASGKLVLLELAPVDPRSLMQGDYMTLRYDLVDTIPIDSIPKQGYCVVKLDENGVAKGKRFQENSVPLNEGEYLIKYRRGNWSVNIGAESYFFEEGQAEKYDSARYGGIKIDEQGNSLLVGLYDRQLRKLE